MLNTCNVLFVLLQFAKSWIDVLNFENAVADLVANVLHIWQHTWRWQCSNRTAAVTIMWKKEDANKMSTKSNRNMNDIMSQVDWKTLFLMVCLNLVLSQEIRKFDLNSSSLILRSLTVSIGMKIVKTHSVSPLFISFGTSSHQIQVTVVWALFEFPKFWPSESVAQFAHCLTLTVLVSTIDAQWEGMGDVGLVRYEPALIPPCLTIRVLSYSN